MDWLNRSEDGEYYKCDSEETAEYVYLSDIEYAGFTDDDGWTGLNLAYYTEHIYDLRNDEEEAKRELEEADALLKDAKDKFEAELSAMHALDDEVTELVERNEGLLDAMREKANDARKLSPGHSGYVITRADQEKLFYRDTDDEDDRPYEDGWKTTIQTPFDISIPIEAIEKTLIYDLSEALSGNIGIYKGHVDDVPECLREGNVVYNYDFHVNYKDKKHLWGICLHSTHQLFLSDDAPDEASDEVSDEAED